MPYALRSRRFPAHWIESKAFEPPHGVPGEGAGGHVGRGAFGGERYRRRRRHPNRIATLFGSIELCRYPYEPLERGERSIHPLELHLGIEAGLATPALAERVGWWTAGNSERVTLEILRRDHGVQWSKKTLRRLTSSLSSGMASHRHEAQVAKMLAWLAEAERSGGGGRPVLSVGRDGIHTPIRRSGYQEGAVATMTVHNRRGKRLGTVYLAQMPEPGQAGLQLGDPRIDRYRHSPDAGGPMPVRHADRHRDSSRCSPAGFFAATSRPAESKL